MLLANCNAILTRVFRLGDNEDIQLKPHRTMWTHTRHCVKQEFYLEFLKTDCLKIPFRSCWLNSSPQSVQKTKSGQKTRTLFVQENLLPAACNFEVLQLRRSRPYAIETSHNHAQSRHSGKQEFYVECLETDQFKTHVPLVLVEFIDTKCQDNKIHTKTWSRFRPGENTPSGCNMDEALQANEMTSTSS